MENHLRVLIVEDSEDDTLLAVSELESSGYDVDFIRVDTSEAMSHALETHSWDIVISDHSMPHFTSGEALKLVLDTGKVIPFILLTGTIGEEGAAQIMRAGADDFLLKASLGRLGPVVDRCIQHAAERRVLPETQKSLLESGARLKMALEAAGMGMWNLEVLTGKFVVDEQSARLAGLRLAEIDPTLELWTDLIHPDDRDRVLRVFRAHLEGVTPVYEDEYRIVDRKGRCKWILSKGKVIERGEDGTPLRVAGTYLDITARRRQSDALRESEQSNRLLVEQSPVAIGILQDGVFVYVNPQFLEIFGYNTQDEVHGRPAEDFIAPQDRELFTQRSKDRMFGKPVPLQYDLGGLKKNGYAFDLAMWPKIITYNEKPAILIFCADTSEAKSLRSQLLQAQKMEAIGTLAGGVAHDFNNLLQIFLGYSQLLLIDKHPDHPDYRNLNTINASAKRGADLVQRLMVFSRKGDTKPHALNLNHEVTQIKKLLDRTIPKMITIELSLEDALPVINADSVQVEQILLNLAINAKDSMPQEGGKLTIETRNITLDEEYCRTHLQAKPGQYVVLSVSDTGHGMSQETVQHIFEPFFTTKGVGKGTGLGLAMVYGIMKHHEGFINCYSELGHGTTFRLYFPVVPTEIEENLEQDNEVPLGGSESILLVDDEELLCDIGSQILTRAGYTVLTATNGKEALDLYGKERSDISLVILDLIMPEMGGKECFQELVNIDSKVRVILSSGFLSDGTTEEATVLGVRGLVEKPYNMRQLLHMVRKVLDAD